MKFEASDTIKMLNDLLHVTNGRAEGYTKAAEEEDEIRLRRAFKDLADVSTQNAKELVLEITKSGGIVDSSHTLAEIETYNAWMDFKSVFTGQNRQTVLSSGKYGEAASARAFSNAMDCKDLSAEVRQMLRNQQIALTNIYNMIKSFDLTGERAYSRDFIRGNPSLRRSGFGRQACRPCYFSQIPRFLLPRLPVRSGGDYTPYRAT